MRARKVQESVSFRRGDDPKKSLGIGIYSKLQELANFLEKELSWNGASVSVEDDGSLIYECMPGNSVISYIRGAIAKFGWDGMMKVNIADECSRVRPDDCMIHYYRIAFKKPYIAKMGLTEGLNFERGVDPKRSMGIGQWRDGYLIEKDTDSRVDRDFINRLLDFSDYQWDKNPTNIAAVRGETEVTPELAAELDLLPVGTFKYFLYQDDMIGLLDDWPEDFPFRKVPFIANVEEGEGRTFLIDSSGYAYARYITELV